MTRRDLPLEHGQPVTGGVLGRQRLLFRRDRVRVGPVRKVDEIEGERLTFGQRAADRVAAIVGPWRFIVIQSFILAVWAWLNLTAWIQHWDPYPFILMNLFLSLQAACTAPMLMMSQNRLAAREGLSAQDEALAKIVEALGAKLNGNGER